MLKPRVLSPQVVMHHRQLVAREVALLLGVMFIALLLQLGGRQIPFLLLDGALIASGFIGLLTAVFLAGNADRWWFIGLATIAMISGLTQLFWSSGTAIGLLVLVAIPPILDALANIVMLALHIWPGFRRDTQGSPASDQGLD